MTLTHEQQAAVYTHDRHLIVTAGAGSGKTRVLVERFLALLEANPDWTLPSVVAITFTEKAAREMRDRVRRAIDARIAAAALENDDAALTRWLDHQAALSRARIGTIHALCAHILRSNPAEARRDPAFEMLDENEAAVVRDDAVEQALARLVHADHPAAALLAAYGVRTVRGVLARYAGRGGAQAVYDALDRPDEALLAEWETHRQAALESLMADVHADAALRDALNWIRPSDLPPGDKLSDVWALVHAQTDALLGTDPAAFVAAVDALAGGIRLNAGSAKNWGGKDQVDESKAVLRGIRDTVQAIQGALPSLSAERDAEAVAWLALWWDAIQAAADAYTRLKHGRNALDFDDLETLARNLLRQHPHVAARYAHEFRHVMVDEFQDTNHAQRDIVYALAGVGQPGSEGRLFVVGDPKQSIYAFRGADVSVFGAVRDDLIAQGGQELPLATSFRTHEVLVTMLNTIFERLLSPGSSPTARYEVDFGHPMAAARPSEPADIPAHACPLAVLAIPQPDIGPEAAPDERLSADDLRRWEAWTLAQHIHDLVRAGTPVWDRDLAHDDLPPGAFVPPFAAEAGRGAYRPVCYGDVAVLFQAMTRVPLYEDVFKAAGLPYVTVAGKGYFDRQEVWDLLYLLSALHNPNDDLALAVALRSPLFGLSDDALYALRRVTHENGDRVSLARALDFYVNVPSLAGDDAAACDFARGVLSELRGLAGRVSIADLLTRAVHLTGYQAALTGLADGARRRGNVEKLITLARDSGRVSLGAFDAYARDLAAREVREGEAAVEIEGAVVLMSVHASKGLEFPVVALADTSWDRTRQAGVFTLDPVLGAVCKLPTDDPASEIEQPFAWEWARTLAERRDRAERRRLLYVAATRAQDYLIVSGSLHRAGENSWLRQWLAALGVLDEDLILPDDSVPADDTALINFGWGQCTLTIPRVPPAPDDLMPGSPAAESSPGLGFLDAETAAPVLPPLLADVPFERDAPARALTATQIAKLGHAPYYDPAAQGLAAFRHSVLFDMPEPVRPLVDRTALPDDHRLRRVIGEIVHQALQAWLLPDAADPAVLMQRLETIAWQLGLSDPDHIRLAISRALDLLRRFEGSDVRADLDRASQVYRELPFMYWTGRRMIHGVIDVLYHMPVKGGQWHVMDYKTALVSQAGAYANAKRYYLQVGVYAKAVEAKTGQLPETHLYYIHPGQRVYVKPAYWQAALDRLEDDIRAALAVEQVDEG